jgi:hypothetical protein
LNALCQCITSQGAKVDKHFIVNEIFIKNLYILQEERMIAHDKHYS